MSPHKRNQWCCRGTEPCKLLTGAGPLLVAPVHLTILIVRVHPSSKPGQDRRALPDLLSAPKIIISGANKSARGSESAARICSRKSPLQKGVLGVIFSPRNQRENAHSKSANFEGRHSGGHLLGRPLLFTAPSFLTTRAKTGCTAHVFAAQGGTRRPVKHLSGQPTTQLQRRKPPNPKIV